MLGDFKCINFDTTYSSVVDEDITGGHVAMENVFFQVLDESALRRQGNELVC